MASFLTAAAAAIGSSSIGGALVRILVAYGVSRLINKATGNSNSPEAVDQGIRLQVGPDTTNTIPVLYGSAYLGGKVTDAQLVDSNKTMWYCLTLSEVPTTTTTRLSDGATITTTVDEVYWNNQRVYFKADGVTIDYIVNQDGVVDTSPRDLVKIYLYNGSSGPTRPSDLLEYLPALPTLHGDARTLMPGWVSDERMLGLTFALVKISYNRDKGITGLPELQFKVSNNLFRPGDAIYAYLRNQISGAGLSASEIDTASLIALNNYADDTVSYYDEDDGQTKTLANRYQINGIINSAEAVMNNLQKLAGNAGCFLNHDIATGLWGVTLNKNETPVLAFNDSNIISGIDLTGTDLASMYNAIEVQFPHRNLRDQLDTIRIDLPEEYRNTNEPDNILQLKLDLLNEPLQARELGYLELYQNRMDQIVTFTTDYSKINTEAGDVITVSTDVYNWVNKPFRVVRVREIESEEGGLAVEITAQEYDSTMYTAGGVPRRPRVPSEPIAIPDIAVIGTPAAPTVVEINNVAVPALDITGVTPSGIVDRFEYWYSSDSGATYKILGSRANSNGSPYTQGTSLTFRAASLPAGTYLFKVRGGNEKAFGDFSSTTSKTWAPVQVTDQVTAATTVGGGLSDLIGPLAMGAIAYFAYQALYPEVMKALGDSALGEIFGIPSSAVQEMKNAAGNFKLIQVGDSIQTPYNNDTITFIAGSGIEITAEADAGTITISATGGGTGAVNKIIAGEGITVTPAAGTGDVTISLSSGSGGGSGGGPIDSGGSTSGSSYVLNGSVFPCTYDVNNQDKPAIFTHGNMVFANSAYGDTIKRENIVTPETILTPILTTTGDVVPSEPPDTQYDTDQFTGGPSTASTDTASEAAARADAVAKANALYGTTWTETSFNEVKTKLNDNGTYTTTYILRVKYPLTTSSAVVDTRTDNYRYYSKCTYNSALGLAEQSWSAWFKWKEPVTETKQVITGYTNPPPENITLGYVVDGEYTSGGVGLKTPGTASQNYDVFQPNIPTYTTTSVTVDYQTVTCAPGEMVAFGVCNRDLGDTVAFASNTIFGIETTDAITRSANKSSFAGTTAVGNGSIYVSPDPTVYDQLYWSTDTITWNKVIDVTFTGAATTSQQKGFFKVMPYNAKIGKFIAYRNYNNSLARDFIAYSTNGKAWTETDSALPSTFLSGSVSSLDSFRSNNTSGEYIAYPSLGGIYGNQYYAHYSIDGLSWTALPSSIKALNRDVTTMFPIPGSNNWLTASYNSDILNYFTLASGTVGNFTFAANVKGIKAHITELLNAKTQPSNWGDSLKAQNNQRYNDTGNISIIPRSATSFYVVCPDAAVYWYRVGDTFNQGYRDAIGPVYATYTVSGTTITASSFTTTDPGRPAEQSGNIITLATGVTRYTIYPIAPVAYATEYHYPGVGGTPVIYRAGDYGVGAYSNSVSLKATYSTA